MITPWPQEYTSKNILSEESARLWGFFATFICHQVPFFLKISLKFINFQEHMNFYFFNFNYLHQYYQFFYLYLVQKNNDVSIYMIISAASWLGIISDMLLENCIKLPLYWVSSSSNMKGGGGGHTDPTLINHLQRVKLRFIKLK